MAIAHLPQNTPSLELDGPRYHAALTLCQPAPQPPAPRPAEGAGRQTCSISQIAPRQTCSQPAPSAPDWPMVGLHFDELL